MSEYLKQVRELGFRLYAAFWENPQANAPIITLTDQLQVMCMYYTTVSFNRYSSDPNALIFLYEGSINQINRLEYSNVLVLYMQHLVVFCGSLY
jgi:hypothetical protein